MSLPSLPQDKANHALYGAFITLVVLATFTALGIPHAPQYALGAAVVAGALKEVVDRMENMQAVQRGEPSLHGVEFWDAAATWAGGLIVFLAAVINGH